MVVAHEDAHVGSADKLVAEQFLGKGVFDVLLDGTTEGAGAKLGAEALFDEELPALGGEGYRNVPLGETVGHAGEFDVHDVCEVLAGEGAEDDRVVEAVEELGAEVVLHDAHQALLHLLIGLLARLLDEAQATLVADHLGADVGRENENHVLEVHVAAVAIGQAALFHDLEQHVEHIGMGLLDFVQQHHGVGAAADALGELAAFLVAHVAGRGAHEPRHVVLLHVLGHVDLDEGVLLAEHELGEGAGKQRLADAGGAKEDEGADGTAGVFESRARAAHGLGDGADGLVLTHHPLMEFVLHLQQALRLFVFEACERDAGHAGDHFGDDLVVHHAFGFLHGLAPFAHGGFGARAELLGTVAQAGGALEILAGHGHVLFLVEAGDLFLELLEVGRTGGGGYADAGAGFVHHVDGLVGQVAAADVAAGQLDGQCEGLVGVPHAVVGFVAVAEAAEDPEGFLLVGRIDHDGLEAAFEGSVLFHVLPVFVQGGGADALDLAAREGGLEHVGRVDGAFGAAGPHEGVQLVDEEDDVARLAHLVHHGLDALLELPAVLGACDHECEVEHHDAAVEEILRHVAGNELHGEAFDDGGLAHAGFAEEHGVVLGAPGEYLGQALDFAQTADHGVELVPAGQLGEIAPEGVESRGVALGFLGAARGGFLLEVRAEEAVDLVAHVFELEAESGERLCRGAVVLAQQAEEQVLGADVVVAEGAGLFERQLEHAFGSRRVGELLARGHGVRPPLDLLLDFVADFLQFHAHLLQHHGGHPGAFLHEGQENVLGAHIVVVESLRLEAGKAHHLSGAFGETVEHPVGSCVKNGA